MIREGLNVKENNLSDMLPHFLSLIVVEVLLGRNGQWGNTASAISTISGETIIFLFYVSVPFLKAFLPIYTINVDLVLIM